MEHFGVSLFLEITGANFQHWIRVILSLMNSISLSVRSIAVDFVVSLFGSVFDLYGNIDEVALVFSSVLPEVAAREVAFYCVSGHVSSMDDISKAVWPLRRAIATFTFKALGPGKTEVTMQMEFTPKFGVLGQLMAPMLKESESP